MKICILLGVGVTYLRNDHKLVRVFFITNERRKRMYWEGSGNISKLKTN